MTEAQFKLAIVRSEKLLNYYTAERRIGTPPLLANERMHEFAKQIDAADAQRANETREYEQDLQVIRDMTATPSNPVFRCQPDDADLRRNISTSMGI